MWGGGLGDYVSSQHAPVCCPPICKALWDMTNGVLCVKDGGGRCERSPGRGEVNYLGLNRYLAPPRGPHQQTGGRRGVSNRLQIQVTAEKPPLFLYLFSRLRL